MAAFHSWGVLEAARARTQPRAPVGGEHGASTGTHPPLPRPCPLRSRGTGGEGGAQGMLPRWAALPKSIPGCPPGRARQRGAVWVQRPAPKAPGVPGQLPAAASCSPRGCCWHGDGGGTQPGCSHRGDAHGSAPTCGTRRCFSSRNHPAGPPLSERIPQAQCSSGVCSPSLISLPFSPVASLSCFQERFAKRPAVLQPLLRALAAQPPPETLSPHPKALRFAAGTRRELRCHRSGRRPAAPRVLVTWLSRFVWRHRNLLDFGTAGARGRPWWQ